MTDSKKYTVKKVTPRPFKGDSGEEVQYFWIKLLRHDDGVTIEAGSKTGNFSVGEEIFLVLEKKENGKYKIVS